MKYNFLKTAFAVCIMLSFQGLQAVNYYVATNGNDANSGLSGSPFLTLTKALSKAVSGDIINVASGTYTHASTISISKNQLTIRGAVSSSGVKPLLNFSSMSVSSSNYGINLSGNNCVIYGLEIKGAGDNGIKISGNSNTVENCSFLENRDTGCQLSSGASNNKIINCDSYYNADPGNGNADGFAAKLDVGSGNSFYGCRAWQNSDDAWDGYMRGANDVSTTLENCWAFKNGYLKSGSASAGNGNGFKMGGSDDKTLMHNFTLKNCVAFQNRVKGFDQNNNKGSMTLLNCSAFNNGTNYQISQALNSGKTLTVKNSLSAGTGAVSLLGNAVQATNSWMSGFTVTNADFLSVDPSSATAARSSDGKLPEISFLHLATGSDLIDRGTDIGLAFNGSKPDLGAFETGTTVVVNKAPTVSLTSPSSSASFTAPASITLTASAADADGTVSKVEFYNGSTLLNSDATSPYSFSWTSVAAGTYSITAKATDNSGASTSSSVVSITVTTATVNNPPTVSITAPVNNASFTSPASITITASAADADGTVSKVDFYNGTTLLGSDASSPYSFSWTSVAAGTYSITAKATDNSGASTSSSVVSITVTTATVNNPPTVSITAPVNNASFTAPASINITASAADADGTVSKVDFYNGTTLLGTDASSPYSFSWNSVAAGTYSITAKATDNGGKTTTSTSIGIVVSNPTTTDDIAGPGCITANSTFTYQLSTSVLQNATSINYWYTGATITSASSALGKVTITTNAYVSGGEFCAGVNYSGSPYYKSYCKSISVCAARIVDTPMESTTLENTIYPNPSAQEFFIEGKKNMTRIVVKNQLGETLLTTDQLSFGGELASGTYYATIYFEDGSSSIQKLYKIR